MYSPMILKRGMQHYELKLYKVYINDDPELTYFTTVSNLAKMKCTYGRPIYKMNVNRTIGQWSSDLNGTTPLMAL